MASKSSPQTAADLPRRKLLKLAGTSMFVGGLGMAAVSATAADGAPPAIAGGIVDVVIIGGGLAGLTAARDLRKAGCESFLVLEARDRVGGRTLNFDAGGGHFSEVGGQWIGPGQTAVADLARELAIGTFPSFYEGKTVMVGGDGRYAIDLEGTFGTDLTISHKLSEMARDVPSGAPWKSVKAAELDRLTVGDWLAKQGIKPEDQNGWDATVSLSGGTPPARMGLLHYLSMINSANSDFEQLDSIRHSAQETRIEGGSQILSIRIAEELGDRLRLASPVRRITGWDRDVVTLQTDAGEVHARRVIMALSPPLCNQIQYDPPLPAARAELHRAWPAHTPGRKTAMVYKSPFWRASGLNGHIFQVGGPVIWAYDNSPANGEIGIINAFVRNALLPSDPKEAQRTQCEIYAQALGDEALNPVKYHDLDWGLVDPWTITCVSAIPPGFWSKHGEALRPPCGNLIWSGTETADIWAGYMDGAVRSGHTAALQALNGLRA